jgi:hypothetical protein
MTVSEKGLQHFRIMLCIDIWLCADRRFALGNRHAVGAALRASRWVFGVAQPILHTKSQPQ